MDLPIVEDNFLFNFYDNLQGLGGFRAKENPEKG